MADQNQSSEIVVRQNHNTQLTELDHGLSQFLIQQDLPIQAILVPVKERVRVFNNLNAAIESLPEDKRRRSIYISKFVAAVAAGLFDAALNYLWDETITELRQRIAQYDLSYFYDMVAVSEKRKGLNSVDDLVNITDNDLIRGAREIGLINDMGYRHLDYIRTIRNIASAAHPNQNEITGMQLVTWLETCIQQVILLPTSNIVADIKRLLHNIKTSDISEAEAREIGAFFLNLAQEQVNNLVTGFFGIYTRSDTNSVTRQNIHRLLPLLWNRVSEEIRQQLGIRYGKLTADSDASARFARQFLELVSAIPYIPDALRAAEIETALDNLLAAHRAWGNFYDEPPFARQLQRLIGNNGKLPSSIEKKYILSLVEVFLTNGNGVARNAQPVYLSLLNLFDSKQAFVAILSVFDDFISSKLQFAICRNKYRELLELMKIKISMPALKELIDDIENTNEPIEDLKNSPHFRQRATNAIKILNLNITL